ncbi:DNA/RNA non-specific endonuclease [Arthrobacter sp. ISL-65]|uniref:DNA/RNA non-specific endonuclease n=1 Tax=Arthrobacter sp. ISL-65 TaxID=2819112 RepID=UPI0027E12CDB|nr:DNA/RNA non-specific endonuclease [Arthrobacter sp. ISL-65]
MPLPALAARAETALLLYTHFSVLMRLDKRLAAVTGVGIDGEKLMDLDRSGINWRLDPRLPAEQQTGERVYARNDLDRGDLVRRSSAVWGDAIAEAEQANEDTFHYTNAAPQAAKFNQGMELWLGIEDYLQQHAAQYRSRVVVFTGPIFSALDPVYRGVDIPLRFFKVAAFIPPGRAGGHRLRGGPDPTTSQHTGCAAARRC